MKITFPIRCPRCNTVIQVMREVDKPGWEKKGLIVCPANDGGCEELIVAYLSVYVRPVISLAEVGKPKPQESV